MFKFGNVTLIKLDKSYLSNLLALKSESWETTHQITVANMDDQIRWFESLDKNVHTPKNLILIACGPVDELASVAFGVYKITDIDWASRTANVAWDIFKHHRGKGLGKPLVSTGAAFCFQVFNLHRLNCEILETNIASQKCADAAGFKKEGVKRESVLKKGFYLDSWLYGVLSKDFALQQTKNQVN